MANQRTGPRRNKEWVNIPASTNSFTGNATGSGGALESGTKLTVLRMLGEYAITLVPAPVALDECEIAVAIGVISSDAFALGASAFPDPVEEPEYPWLYWASHKLFAPEPQ